MIRANYGCSDDAVGNSEEQDGFPETRPCHRYASSPLFFIVLFISLSCLSGLLLIWLGFSLLLRPLDFLLLSCHVRSCLPSLIISLVLSYFILS